MARKGGKWYDIKLPRANMTENLFHSLVLLMVVPPPFRGGLYLSLPYYLSRSSTQTIFSKGVLTSEVRWDLVCPL
jgi:hypothetical protein